MNENMPPAIRRAHCERVSRETQVTIELELDGEGHNKIHTGFGMLDHMIDLLAFWADMNVQIHCEGDLNVDAHHTVEDIGLVLGMAFHKALDGHFAIERTACCRVPMDDALAEACVDISGRPWLEWRGSDLLPPIIAHEEKDVWREFYKSFVSNARINLHITFLYGLNGHHLLESAAKSTGLALRNALRIRGKTVRSTKGELDW